MRANLEDNLARRVRHIASRFGATELTLQGIYALSAESGTFHFLNPNGVSRDVLMPPIELGGGQFYIVVNSGVSGSLNVKTHLGVAIVVVAPSTSAMLISSPHNWQSLVVLDSLAAFQPLDGDLTSLAAAATNGKFYYRSADDTWAPVTVSSPLTFTLGTLSSSSGGGNVSSSGATTNGYLARWTAVGNTIEAVDGATLFQAKDSELTALSGVTAAVNKLPYFDSTTTMALADFSPAGRALVDDADVAAMRTTLGVAVCQAAYSELVTWTSTAGAMAGAADTIPQITDGTELLTLTMTPKATTNKLRVRVLGEFTSSTTGAFWVGVFRDSAANAIVARMTHAAGVDFATNVVLDVEIVAGSIAATTFRVRYGCVTAGSTIYINGLAGGRRLGGSQRLVLEVLEIQA